MFSFATEEGDVYYMKLEAFWILNNLACAPGVPEIRFLLGDGSETSLPKNQTLTSIEMELTAQKKQGYKDGKTLKMLI